MKTSASLILGSCVLLQTLPWQQNSAASITTDGQVLSAVLYRLDQAPELLGTNRAPAQVATANNALYLKVFVHSQVDELLPTKFEAQSHEIAEAVLANSQRYNLDPLLVMGLIQNESMFNPDARGTHGEIGLTQMKPSTAQWLIEQGDIREFAGLQSRSEVREALKNPVTNIAFGAAYLARLKRSFKNRGPLFVSAYNMGSVCLKSKLRSGNRPRVYSDRVLAAYASFQLEFVSSVRDSRFDVADNLNHSF